MKLTKIFLLFLFLSLKGISQQVVLTSSGEKVVLNYLSSFGGTISGTLTTSGTINDLTVSRGGGNVNGNTAVGGSALNANNNSGINNAAFGSEALLLNQGGGHNTALGKDALRTNVSGNYSTAVGYQSLKVNTVSNNTAIGYRSMFTNSSGTDNTAIGYQSLDGNTTGTQNTAIGANANVNFIDLSNSTAIGYYAIATTSNTIQLGNAYITKINTSGAITAGGMQNTPIGSTIANTGAFTTLSVSDATSITGTLTLPSLSASTLLGTNGIKGVSTGNLTGDITTSGFAASIVDGAVTEAKIADGAVTGNKIALEAVDYYKIATGAVASFHIQDLAITDAKVTDVSATKITGTLAISQGGTNSTATPTAGGIGYGTGTAHAYTVAGTAGQILSSNGAGVPTWTSAVITTTAAPSLSNSPGIKGEIRIDANFIYVCTATNTWKKVAIVDVSPM